MTIEVDNQIVELTPELAVKLWKERLQAQEQNQRLEALNQQQDLRIAYLIEQLKLMRYRQFGTRSEHFDPTQELLLLFNEAETTEDPKAPEPEIVVGSHSRKKKSPQRQLDLDALPVEEVHYQLPDEELTCPQCQGALHQMSQQVRTEVELIPAKLVVVKHIRPIYTCRHCYQEGEPAPIKTAPMPAPAFPGSLASASLVAHILSQKFVEGLPLYRQEQYFKRNGIQISRQTMANWTLKGADWLESIYQAMKSRLLLTDIIHADETRVQVLHEPGRKATTDSTMWLYRSGRDGPPIALFEYQYSDAAEHAIAFLAGYTGYLTCDGNQCYEKVPGVTLCGCWAHARRRFFEAVQVLPEAARKKTTTLEATGLSYCNALYTIERELHDASPEERLAARQERSQPKLKEFHKWLKSAVGSTTPKSSIGNAVRYCLNQWSKLERYLLDGRLEIDNNRAERTIKPFVIGRKNWLFANTEKGARASAVIYSVVETARENGLDPFRYLQFVFEQLPTIDMQNQGAIGALLPWSPAAKEAAAIPTPTA